MYSISPWIRKALWIVYPVVVFFIATWLQDLITTAIHPLNARILDSIKLNASMSTSLSPSSMPPVLLPLIITLIIVGLTAAWRIDVARDGTDELKGAYIRMRHAYKKAAGITTKDTSHGMDMSVVKEGSKEHLQQLRHEELYMDAERLAHEVGIPDDA